MPTWEDNKRKYITDYNRANMKDVVVHINKKTESDILEHLEMVPNKNGYIKSLIREDIRRFSEKG